MPEQVKRDVIVHNPFIDDNAPDICLTEFNSRFYAYTTGEIGSNIFLKIFAGDTLQSMRFLNDPIGEYQHSIHRAKNDLWLRRKPKVRNIPAVDGWQPEVREIETSTGRVYCLWVSVFVGDLYKSQIIQFRSDSPEGPFQEEKKNRRLTGYGYTGIDFHPFRDPSTEEWWSVYSSGGAPIMLQALSPDLLGFKENSRPIPIAFPSYTHYGWAYEGAVLDYNEGCDYPYTLLLSGPSTLSLYGITAFYAKNIDGLYATRPEIEGKQIERFTKYEDAFRRHGHREKTLNGIRRAYIKDNNHPMRLNTRSDDPDNTVVLKGNQTWTRPGCPSILKPISLDKRRKLIAYHADKVEENIRPETRRYAILDTIEYDRNGFIINLGDNGTPSLDVRIPNT